MYCMFVYKVRFSFIIGILLIAFPFYTSAQTTDLRKRQLPVAEILPKAYDLLNSGKIMQSLHFIDSAYQQLAQISKLDQWEIHNFKSNLYLNHKTNAAKAKLQIDSMYLTLADNKLKYPYQYVSTLFSDGDLLFLSRQHVAASKKYYEGITFAKKHLEVCELSDFSKRLADFKYRQGKFVEAIPYFKLALVEISACNNSNDFDRKFMFYQSNLNTIALCFEKSEMPDSAIAYYHKTLQFLETNKSKFPHRKEYITICKAVVYGNLGGLYATIGKYSLAEQLLKKSIAINYEPGYLLTDAQFTQLKLARLYLKTAQLKHAKTILAVLEKDIAKGKEEGNEVLEKIVLQWYQLKWKFFEQQEDYKRANAFQSKYYILRDSLENKDLTANHLEASFKAIQNTYDLSILNKTKTLNSLYLWGATTFSVMMVVILFLIVNHLKRSKKNFTSLQKLNKTISDKNTQLEGALSELEERKEENNRMMKIVYHDLRSPIGGMTMAVGLMLQDNHHNEEDQEMLQMIQTSGQDAISLINDMLQFNSIVEIIKQPVYIPSLLEYCQTIAQFKADLKQQTIEINATPIFFLLDEEKIRRVIGNLISNAIKFSPVGSKIILTCIGSTDTLIITCEDFGIGVPKNEAELIFDMFTPAKKTGTMGEETFGMGLAICRQILHAHNGKISCKSKEGPGSTFEISISA